MCLGLTLLWGEIHNIWGQQKCWASEKLKGVSVKNKASQWSVVLEIQDWCLAFIKEGLISTERSQQVLCNTDYLKREGIFQKAELVSEETRKDDNLRLAVRAQ